MAKNLVIVESPAKAKTINKYLGSDYMVLASMGHVRDLPPKDGSVDPENNFAMKWEESERSSKPISAIAKEVKLADNIYLATDPDREGEAISWHLADLLGSRKLLKGKNVSRVTFNEITKSAVQEAFKHARAVDQDLVDAYLARRALDYLVGFNLSPVLWRKLPGARSAGRVQSVALRLICDREREIETFIPQEYWTITAQLTATNGQNFKARLTHADGKKLDKFSLNNETSAKAVLTKLEGQQFTVIKVEKKQVQRHPSAPFITSTLQMEASRKLGFGASKTMRTAQRLYEGVDIGGETVGLITYMRTDGPTLSGEAIAQARAVIAKEFGDEYLPEKPRQYSAKAKNAQEAHEAIRPTDSKRTPAMVGKYLEQDARELYELIWKRTVASQMMAAKLDQVAVDIEAANKAGTLRANGSVIAFDGFLKVYFEDTDDVNTNDDDENRILPPMAEKDKTPLQSIAPHQHFTEPLPRYSEASLVKKLEELGIGRPSTYASIIQVLQDRQYVRIDKKRFHPEERGRVVTAFLQNFFAKYVEYDFTASLENELDDIAEGKLQWQKMLDVFWKPFHAKTKETINLKTSDVLDVLNVELAVLLFPAGKDGKPDRKCPACEKGLLSLKPGKFGFFVGCSEYPTCKYTRQLSQDINGDDTTDGGKPMVEPKLLGKDPATGGDISIRLGPYGPYVQLDLPESMQPKVEEPVAEVVEEKPAKATKGKKKAAKPKKPKKPAVVKPKRASLPKGLTIEATTLEKAIELLALPRLVGTHPETGDKIEANNGRFGPYLKYQSMFVSIPKGDDLFTIGMNRAVDLIAIKKEKIANGTLKTFGRKKPAAKEKPAAKKKAAPKKKKA
jgi:DNA topoisomerase-1